MNSLKHDPGLHQLLPRIILFISEGVIEFKFFDLVSFDKIYLFLIFFKGSIKYRAAQYGHAHLSDANG